MKDDIKKNTKKTNYVKVPKEDMSRWEKGGAGIRPATKPYVAKKKEGK